MENENIYDSEFVEELFDKMSGSYDRMNYITSFGFSSIWRKKFIHELDFKNTKVVVDLMTGMGECWNPILKATTENTKIIALDFSSEMIKHANSRISIANEHRITTLKENVFSNSIESEIADKVVSGFGMKTFNAKQLNDLALEINRILKEGGEFSLIDVSVPRNKLLRFFYMFYLKQVIPILGRLFLGNPSTYKMLGIYTEKFQNSKEVHSIFSEHFKHVEYYEYFFGCASGIKGRK